MPANSSFAFVFVCQAGVLENKSLLLAASLRRYAPGNVDLVAAIPVPSSVYGTPADSTLSLLKDLGVRTVEIKNEIAADYPIGNKVSCLKVPTDRDRLIFLDTDMLLARPFTGLPGPKVPFAAKPADLLNISDRSQWRRAYAAAGLKIPDARVFTSVYGQTGLPYFNAGLISVDPAAGIGQAWADCCRKIDAKWGIRLKRPHLDQIALPVAVAMLKLPFLCLDERFNFPAHLKPICAEDPPTFVHYHSPDVLRREPMLIELVRELCDEHPALARQLKANADYAPIFDRRPNPARRISTARENFSRPADPTPELIITGIPRSGTSYLCNLLHRFENCVVLNEPDGVARSLRKEPIPFGVANFYRNIRRDVLEGKPIRNKLRDGKVTDETMEVNEQTEYVPKVANEAFVLGVKNPLGFLSRLADLRRAMPQARVAVCVRNPYDTIASWKTTFSHLKTADVASLTIGGVHDPALSARSREALKDVSRMKNPAWRRAAWWRYLADQIIAYRDEVILVPYPIAVADPMSVVNRILNGFDRGELNEPIEPSTVRAARRTALDDEDLQAIRAICTQAAAELGVGEEFSIPPIAIKPEKAKLAPIAEEQISVVSVV